MQEKNEIEYCRYCNQDNEVYSFCTECVGQYGRNVVQHVHCTVCDEELHDRLVDKDI